jgi:hypothetical protein
VSKDHHQTLQHMAFTLDIIKSLMCLTVICICQYKNGMDLIKVKHYIALSGELAVEEIMDMS